MSLVAGATADRPMPTVEAEDGEVRPMWLEEMAEQLKAGGNIELSEHSESQGNRTGK